MNLSNRLTPVLVLTACLLSPPVLAQSSSQDEFFQRISDLCGKAFAGRMTHYSRPSDDGWLDREVVIHVRECSADEIRIPLHVGDNRSRTWVIRREPGQLVLKHDHRHEDGSEDAVTWYGGHTRDSGRPGRQTFPVDAWSQALFLANGLEASIENFWSMEVEPGRHFAYELVRSRRMFRAEFDLSRPVEAPPPPWGFE
ncbi:MAG: hypothetical protein CVV18_07960 [Gammaproteobacteria bacterium HGW-Gammaproteobacteria-8]|nr:MAG: hypothetical protein CVV18_07960 [Gammaproteobacteria bacterium HGW-Gammaproteobacteria-8]